MSSLNFNLGSVSRQIKHSLHWFGKSWYRRECRMWSGWVTWKQSGTGDMQRTTDHISVWIHGYAGNDPKFSWLRRKFRLALGRNGSACALDSLLEFYTSRMILGGVFRSKSNTNFGSVSNFHWKVFHRTTAWVQFVYRSACRSNVADASTSILPFPLRSCSSVIFIFA